MGRGKALSVAREYMGESELTQFDMTCSYSVNSVRESAEHVVERMCMRAARLLVSHPNTRGQVLGMFGFLTRMDLMQRLSEYLHGCVNAIRDATRQRAQEVWDVMFPHVTPGTVLAQHASVGKSKGKSKSMHTSEWLLDLARLTLEWWDPSGNVGMWDEDEAKIKHATRHEHVQYACMNVESIPEHLKREEMKHEVNIHTLRMEMALDVTDDGEPDWHENSERRSWERRVMWTCLLADDEEESKWDVLGVWARGCTWVRFVWSWLKFVYTTGLPGSVQAQREPHNVYGLMSTWMSSMPMPLSYLHPAAWWNLTVELSGIHPASWPWTIGRMPADPRMPWDWERSTPSSGRSSHAQRAAEVGVEAWMDAPVCEHITKIWVARADRRGGVRKGMIIPGKRKGEGGVMESFPLTSCGSLLNVEPVEMTSPWMGADMEEVALSNSSEVLAEDLGRGLASVLSSINKHMGAHAVGHVMEALHASAPVIKTPVGRKRIFGELDLMKD
jgi:hypothetical protein